MLTDDAEIYIKYDAKNKISVGLNSVIFESVNISGNNSWTVETSGTSGIDKVIGITDGAILSASITEGAVAGLQFDVETDGAGDFTLCDKKFTSTGDAKNIFTVAKIFGDIKVTTIQKSDGILTANFGNALTVNGNEIQTDETSTIDITCASDKISAVNIASDWLNADFTDGIKINGSTDGDLIKIAGKQKISVADNRISIEDLAPDAVVENFGKVEKISTTSEGIFTIGDYVYQVTGDSDGIQLVKSGNDWTVENLDTDGEVTRLADDISYTWDKQNKIWYETAEDNGPCQITIGADNKLSLTVGGQAIKNYSTRIIQSPASGNAITDGKIILNESVAAKEISIVNNSATTTAINFGTNQIVAGLAENAEVKITADEIILLNGSSDGMTFNLDATRKNLTLADNFQIINDANALQVACEADSITLNFSPIKFSTSTKPQLTQSTTLNSLRRKILPQRQRLTAGNVFAYNNMNFTTGEDPSSYYNRPFLIEGDVKIVGKQFRSDKQDFVKVVDGKIATIEGVKSPADISGDGIQNVSILTAPRLSIRS